MIKNLIRITSQESKTKQRIKMLKIHLLYIQFTYTDRDESQSWSFVQLLGLLSHGLNKFNSIIAKI